MKLLRFLFVCVLVSYNVILIAQPALEISQFATNFNNPVAIANCGDHRLFIVEKSGVIRLLDTLGNIINTSFLDISNKVQSANIEQGLLGITFHHNYINNGILVVHYINASNQSVLAKYTVSPTTSNIANPNSEEILLTVNQPYSNHNGGDLAFGSDGYLYFAIGDGGWAGDPSNNAQNMGILLGKICRIDIDNGTPYAIPSDNPFITNASIPNEIWASGVRNPWRFSFDRLTGDLYTSDVGQDDWEEINFQPANSLGGENYGWRCYEGNSTFITSGCTGIYHSPIHVYPNSIAEGCSVTGGYVYRGSKYPNLYGYYVYADYCSGKFWTLKQDPNGNWTNTFHQSYTPQNFSAFGEDAAGEIYVAGYTDGIIYKIKDGNSSASNSIETQPEFRIFPNPTTDNIHIEVTSNKTPFQVQFFRLDGAILIEKTFYQNEVDIDIKAYTTGFYWLKIIHKDQSWTHKIIKQN